MPNAVLRLLACDMIDWVRCSLRVEIRSALATQGYAYVPVFSAERSAAAPLALARALGSIYFPGGIDGASPHIETNPAADSSYLDPFDRAEGIGWHNDFSTHRERPAVSLALLARADPRGPAHGAWRVASCDRILDHLLATAEGASIVRFLRNEDLPFSFSGDAPPTFLRVVEQRGASPGRLGMRFYGRTMRDGARLAFGSVPEAIERAIGAVEAAADAVGRVLEARPGALLITDNWHALHDRLPQSVDAGLPLRRSLLCFVDHLHEDQDAIPVVNPTH